MGAAPKLDNWEEKKNQVIDVQLKPLEAIAATVAPDKVLEEAERINVISVETRTRIEAVMGPLLHVELFQRALTVEGAKATERNETNTSAAFIRAFEHVYGRFMLEQGPKKVTDPLTGKEVIATGELEHKDSELMKVLDKALKFKVLPEFGLKGRSELQSALRRLREAEVSRNAGLSTLSTKEILERAFGVQLAPEDMKRLERVSHDSAHKKTALEEDHKYFSGDDVKTVQKKYEDIKGSPATSADVRSKEAANTESEAKKTKLGKLKELFAADKATALNDMFQEMEALEPAYLEAVALKDIDKDIATKGAEADLLKSEIETYQKSTKVFEKEKIPKLAKKLAKIRSDLAVLERQKTKRDKFKEVAKKLRAELMTYCREYQEAIKLGIAPSVTAAAIEGAKVELEGVNVEKGIGLQKIGTNYSLLKTDIPKVFTDVEKELKNPEFGVITKQNLDTNKAKVEKAKKFHEELKPTVEKIVKAAGNGVILIEFLGPLLATETKEEADTKATKEFAKNMEAAFKAIKPDHMDFTVEIVSKFYETYLENFLGDGTKRGELLKRIEAGMVKAEKAAKTADKELSLAKEGAEKVKDLTDAQAARKIIGALVGEQFKEMSIMDQEKIAKLLLADDVGKLLNEEGYEALARHGSPELLKDAEMLGIRARLIGFKYKEGDKVVHPFEGLKPENFKDWASIKNLFDIKKLNHKNGFILLAALEIFDEERKGTMENVVSTQLSGTQKKMKELLAVQLGVKDRIDEAGVRKIVDDAFKVQMEKIRPLVRTHFKNHDKADKGFKEVNKHKVDLLNLEYEDLQYKYRTGEIDGEIYDLKLKALVKKANEAGILEDVSFSQASVVDKYLNHRYSQWIADKGINFGKLAGSKIARAAWGATLGTGRGALNAVGKLGLRGSSLGLGVVAKYPASLLTGVGSGFYRIFRSGQGGSWWKDIKADVHKVSDPITGVQDKLVGTSKNLKVFSHIGHHVKSEWVKSKLDTRKYAEKDSVKREKDLRAEKIKLLGEKAEVKPLEITESPFVDLAEFKAKVVSLDKVLGTSTTFPEAKDVKAGTEKSADHPKDEKHEKKEEKKDDHGHPPKH